MFSESRRLDPNDVGPDRRESKEGICVQATHFYFHARVGTARRTQEAGSTQADPTPGSTRTPEAVFSVEDSTYVFPFSFAIGGFSHV